MHEKAKEKVAGASKAVVDPEEHRKLQREHERLKTMYARLHAQHEDLADEHETLKERVYEISRQFEAATSRENLTKLMKECMDPLGSRAGGGGAPG